MWPATALAHAHRSLQNEEGDEDQKKGTQLLEIYALEIQMYTEQKNNKALKNIYEQSLHVKSAIPHPLIMGVIRGTECGGNLDTENAQSWSVFDRGGIRHGTGFFLVA